MKDITPPSQKKSFKSDGKNPDALTVLYVEDNPDNIETLQASLGNSFHLLFATNDREACNILVQQGKSISVILMDIELRDSAMNGIELTKLIRGVRSREDLPDYARQVPVLTIPIIFLTAYGNIYEKREVLRAGGSDFIEKPIDFLSLKLAIAKGSSSASRRGESG